MRQRQECHSQGRSTTQESQASTTPRRQLHLPISVILTHVLPLLDRVCRNRLCSTYWELYVASRKVYTPWPFKRRLQQARKGRHWTVYSTDFSPNRELLASRSGDGIIRIWKRADGSVHDWQGPIVFMIYVFLSTLLACSASQGTAIRSWKLEDQSFIVVLAGGLCLLTS